MLTVKGLSNKSCFLTGVGEDVVEVKFRDGSFSGAINWTTLLQVIKRRTQGESGRSEHPNSAKALKHRESE